MTERKGLARERETLNRETTTEGESSTKCLALSRSLGAARLLASLRGQAAEHQGAVLRSARRRILEAGFAIEKMLDELDECAA
jgi:hypothetical protein